MRKLAVLLVLAAALVAPVAAQAHPLGNFTINRFARVEVAGHRLYVRYVLDMAEIPTFQARQEGVSPVAYARRLAAGLNITVDGRSVVLTPTAHALAFPIGVGGLHTMRLEAIFRGPRVDGSTRVTVHARRTSAPAVAARRRSAGSSADRSNPIAGSPPRSAP